MISKLDYQRLKTMVTRTIDQKIRSQNFQARNGRNGTGALVINRRDESGVERGPRECYDRKAKGQCSEGHNGSFRQDGSQSGKLTPKSAPSFETQKDGKEFFQERRISEVGVLLGNCFESRAETSFRVSARNRHVIFGILPNVRIARNHRRADSRKNVLLCTSRLQGSPAKSRETVATIVLLLY